jgi:hypothetical protein
MIIAHSAGTKLVQIAYIKTDSIQDRLLKQARKGGRDGYVGYAIGSSFFTRLTRSIQWR